MPKRRISIPEGHVALILSQPLAEQLQFLCQTIRRSGNSIHLDLRPTSEFGGFKEIASHTVLAILDSKES